VDHSQQFSGERMRIATARRTGRLACAVRDEIVACLREQQNKMQAAKTLGISRNSLYRWLKFFDVKNEEWEADSQLLWNRLRPRVTEAKVSELLLALGKHLTTQGLSISIYKL